MKWIGPHKSNFAQKRGPDALHLALLKIELADVTSLSKPILVAGIDNQIELITRAVVKSATVSNRPKTTETKSKSMPWLSR
jgi:hypothetical protein